LYQKEAILVSKRGEKNSRDSREVRWKIEKATLTSWEKVGSCGTVD